LAVLNLLRALLFAALAFLKTRRQFALEILALRHQPGVLKRSVKRPRLSNVDRGLWVLLSRRWADWSDALIIVKPATVAKWHRAGFRRYWAWRSQRKGGRPAIDPEIRQLIKRMATANMWGAPRIHGELLKSGIKISEATVSKYLPRRRKPPSQTWRSFLENHGGTLVSVDFSTVPTVFFHVLFVFVVLAHNRRRILSINVTSSPSAAWTVNQIVQAFPWESAPRYLLRDRDGVCGSFFRHRVKDLDIEEVVIARRSPWQSPYVERVIGRLRRELVDHTIVMNERHLRRLLRRYVRSTTTRAARTCRSARTRRSREPRSHRIGAAWSSSRWLVACTICTRGAPPEPSRWLRYTGSGLGPRCAGSARAVCPSGRCVQSVPHLAVSANLPGRGSREPVGTTFAGRTGSCEPSDRADGGRRRQQRPSWRAVGTLPAHDRVAATCAKQQRGWGCAPLSCEHLPLRPARARGWVQLAEGAPHRASLEVGWIPGGR
jgi:putative transposase